MRFNKPISLRLSVCLSVTALFLGQTLAPACALPTSDDITVVDKKAHHLIDAPRQISVSIPGLGKAQITVKPESSDRARLSKPNAGPLSASIPALKGDNIEVKVPQSMQQFIEDGSTAYGQVSKDLSRTWTQVWVPASRLLGSLVAWLGSYFKQAGQTPVTITPAGGPYLGTMDKSSGTTTVATREGRLKTFVSR